MREIGTDAVAITLSDNDEMHLTDSGENVKVEIWHNEPIDSRIQYPEQTGPFCVYQSTMSYAEMVAFVLWTLPSRTQEILREHGVELGLVK